MAFTVMTIEEWAKKLHYTPDDQISEILGYSPGYVASFLGISRQAVHQAIHDDRLDAIRVERKGKLVSINISLSSFERYRRTCRKKAG